MPRTQLDLFANSKPRLKNGRRLRSNSRRPSSSRAYETSWRRRFAPRVEAESLPWPDLTRATLAELRFHSIAGWLPEEEAATLREAFEAEMKRLYQLEDERRPTP